MQDPDLQLRLREINSLLAITVADRPVAPHWGRYMCIMAAGFLESALQTVYRSYASQASDRNVANYVSGQLRRVRNPDAGRFIELARAFNQDWGNDLSKFIDQDGRRMAINEIQRNRNLNAHDQQSEITLAQVRTYFPKCLEVIDFIERQCLDALPDKL